MRDDDTTASNPRAPRIPPPSLEGGATHSAGAPEAPPLLPPREESFDVDAAALLENAKRISGHASALFQEIGTALHGARTFVEQNVEKHPVATLSAAAGAGFVVAGGLSSSVSKLAFRAGTKVAAAWALKKVTEAATGTKIEVEVEKKDDAAT